MSVQGLVERLRRRSYVIIGPTRGGVRMVLSAAKFPTFLFTIYLMAMFISWKQWRTLLISGNFVNCNGYISSELFQPFSSRTDKNIKNDIQKGISQFVAPIHHGMIANNNNSSKLRNVIQRKAELPETEQHFKRLFLSKEFDVKALGAQLANGSTSIYNPGMRIDTVYRVRLCSAC